MEKKLHTIGIFTVEELKELGSKETFFRMKTEFPEVCLVHMYVIQGAIDDVDYNKLPETMRSDLKAFVDDLDTLK